MAAVQAKADIEVFEAIKDDAYILRILFIDVFQHQSGSLLNQAVSQP